ncbi:MAG TPA: hypothetical protein VNO26_02345 [Candidatus Limnocylindria bacterium]|nr:hypothetical protein [Candidatus Limnocylindria bacterium]
MTDLVLAVVAACATAGLGARLLRLVRAVPGGAPDRLIWMLAAGFGAWGLVGLVLAAAQALRPAAVLAVAAAALLAGGADVWRALRALELRRPRLLLVIPPALTLGALAVAVLAPPITGDQTKYQLAYPKLYAEAGGLVATPWTFWGNQQFLANFVFAVAYAVRGERLALLANAAWLPLAAAALTRLVDRHLRHGMGGVAAALLITVPMAWTIASKAGADLALLGYTTLATSAFLDWRLADDGRALRRCALAAGFAGATKVMGLMTPALIGAGVLLVAWRARRRLAGVAGAAVLFGLLAGAAAVAPYARNWVETGNPLYPFAVGLFGGRHWSVEAGRYLDEYYRQYQTDRAARRAGEPYRVVELWRFPWDATMTPESFERAARQSLDVGPFPLAFLPAALWWAWRRSAVAWTLGLGTAYAGIIAAGAWAHPRYVFPGVVLILAAGVAGARAVGGRWLAPVVAATLAGHLVVTSRLAWPLLADQARVATGRLSREAFLEQYSPRWRFWRRACPVIGTAGVVMVLEKIPHPYLIGCRFVLASYLEQALVDYRRVDTPDALEAAARALGVTHVAVARADLARGADPYETQAVAVWNDWTRRLGVPLLETEAYALYALPPAPGAAAS